MSEQLARAAFVQAQKMRAVSEEWSCGHGHGRWSCQIFNKSLSVWLSDNEARASVCVCRDPNARAS